jgi:hypothetical protein
VASLLGVSDGWNLSVAENVHSIPPTAGDPVTRWLRWATADADEEVSVRNAIPTVSATSSRYVNADRKREHLLTRSR